MTDWWFVFLIHFLFFHILRISSSQLRNSYFSEGWLNHQADELRGVNHVSSNDYHPHPEAPPGAFSDAWSGSDGGDLESTRAAGQAIQGHDVSSCELSQYHPALGSRIVGKSAKHSNI